MKPKPLSTTIMNRLLAVALAAFVLQLVYVAIDLASRSQEIEEAVVDRELGRIATGVVPSGSSARVELAPKYAQHYDDFPQAYGYELSTSAGSIIDWRNPALFEGRPVELNTGAIEGMQLDTLAGTERFVALRRISLEGSDYLVRVAVVGDPAGLYAHELRRQVLDRVALPIVPLTAIMLVVLLVVVRQALRPIERAARDVTAVGPLSHGVRLDLVGAPQELLALGSAVNRLLDKLEQAIISHRDFAANVAHELRTPLSILALELEQIEGPIAAQMREDLGSMARLVDQLLAVARIEAVIPEELEAVDLGAIAKRVVARMAPLAIAQGRDIELSVEGTALVRGEPETIAGAIRNLVENAVRAAPAGSAVEVSVGPGRTVTVADHGRGIAQKDLEHIFDRYRQGDRKTAGRAGLGLSIVSRTMERHGGAVTIDTSPNAGCSFTLSFPDIEAAVSLASRSIKPVATGEGVVATVSSDSLATSPR